MNAPTTPSLEHEDAIIEAIGTEILSIKPALDTAVQAFLAAGNHDRTPITPDLEAFASRLREAIRPIDDLSHEAGGVLQESFYQLFQDTPVQLAAQIIGLLENQLSDEENPEADYLTNYSSQRLMELSLSYLCLKDIIEIKSQLHVMIDSQSIDPARVAALKEAFFTALENGPFYYGWGSAQYKVTKTTKINNDDPIKIVFENESGQRRTRTVSVISKILNLFAKIECIEKFQSIPSVDHQKLQADRLTYGAKGANLIALQKLLSNFKEQKPFNLRSRSIEIPPFLTIPAKLYDRWKAGENIDPELQSFFTEAQQYGDILVRSSAVHSEDGEETTGAGIYDSIDLYNEEWDDEKREVVATPITFERFKSAVIDVYKSCDSPEAQAYRKDNNVPQESMGIVIQKLIGSPGSADQMDTSRMHTPNLSEIRTWRGRKLVFDKAKIQKYLEANNTLGGAEIKDLAYLPIDRDRLRISGSKIQRILLLGTLLEKAYGRAIQLEFKDGWEDNGFHKKIQLLQARPIPTKMLKPVDIDFPDQEPITTFNSLGFCDATLPVLSVPLSTRSDVDNSGKTGIVFYGTSDLGSSHLNRIKLSLPKEGVVVMLGNSAAEHGHIETIAVEKDLTILFPQENERGVSSENTHLRDQIRTAVNKTIGNDTSPLKYRIVSNGIEARIYPAN